MVSVTFTLEQGESFGALQARARQLFPRLYGSPEVRWAHAPSSPTHRGDPSVLNRRDVAGTVRAYLQRTLKDDPDAEALRQEADALLAEIESTPL